MDSNLISKANLAATVYCWIAAAPLESIMAQSALIRDLATLGACHISPPSWFVHALSEGESTNQTEDEQTLSDPPQGLLLELMEDSEREILRENLLGQS